MKHILALQVHTLKLILFQQPNTYSKSTTETLLQVNNRNTRKRCQTCSKLTIKTPKMTSLTPVYSVSVVNFEQVNVCWDISKLSKLNVQLHCNLRADIADCLTFLRLFPIRLEICMCSAALG